jgi:hypothetical protein
MLTFWAVRSSILAHVGNLCWIFYVIVEQDELQYLYIASLWCTIQM